MRLAFVSFLLNEVKKEKPQPRLDDVAFATCLSKHGAAALFTRARAVIKAKHDTERGCCEQCDINFAALLLHKSSSMKQLILRGDWTDAVGIHLPIHLTVIEPGAEGESAVE